MAADTTEPIAHLAPRSSLRVAWPVVDMACVRWLSGRQAGRSSAGSP